MPSRCPEFRKNGICLNQACTLSHELHFCGICRLEFLSAGERKTHLASPQHKKRAKAVSKDGYVDSYCEVCDVNVPVPLWSDHVGGERHGRMAAQSGVLPQNVKPQPPKETNTFTMCDVCKVLVHLNDSVSHDTSTQHRRAQSFAQIRSVLVEAAQDRNGVSLSYEDGVRFGTVESASASSGHILDISVKAARRVTIVELNVVGLRAGASSFSAQVLGNPQSSIRVTLKQSLLGEYEGRLEIVFEDLTLNLRFMIVRNLFATVVGDRSVHQLLQPVSPYVQKSRPARRETETRFVPGKPPPVSSKIMQKARKMDSYDIPKYLEAIFEKSKVADAVDELRESVLPVVVNGETYATFWKTLIWAEEYRAELDLHIFDMEDAVLKKHGGGTLYWLTVAGLAEKRPSVLRGDRIHVRHQGSTGKWFEGHVHEIHELQVGLRFGNSFPKPSANQRYNVEFRLNRTPFRRMHQALEKFMYRSDRLLYPANLEWPNMSRQVIARVELSGHLYDSTIAGNTRQMDAVMKILNAKESSPPFVLFGPPGTGKTVTLVEAILQLVRIFPEYRLLVTAPSNSAADLIAQRLSRVLSNKELFRLYGRSRMVKDIPEILRPYALIMANEIEVPAVDELESYRVVVATCVSAALPYQLGVKRGHFNVIFVDEAAQASEPEVMIPLKTMANDQTNFVLAGDPKQLGPVIRSAVARQLGLGTSFLERLTQIPGDMYAPDGGQGLFVVKLVNNYRSHQDIITFPNDCFYAGELVASAPEAKRNMYLGASLLVNKRYPVVFHALSGKNQREATSPSYFNILEAEQVKIYIEQLVNDRGVRYEDIGVIAPYHAQVIKIRKLLRDTGAADAKKIKVGSVEEFQGQERKVIFVSTVRSSRDLVEYDLRHTLGFVSNERRFNVAVTRAQSLLVIVGDPNVLSLDTMWRSFLNIVHSNNGWRGQPIPWDPEAEVRAEGGYDAEAREEGVAELNDLTNRLRAMDVGDEGEAAEDKGPFRESD